MIETEYDTYEVCCDYCSYCIDGIYEEWADIIARMRSEGWRTRKINSEWRHKCPTCVKEKKG
jgi:hypothetical protein